MIKDNFSELEIMGIMNNVTYGWIDKYSEKHNEVNEDFSCNYILQSSKEVLENKIGVCWDQVELERYLFNDINVKTYFIVYYDSDKCPTHTYLTFMKNNKFYCFERSWEIFRGIHEYNSLKELLADVKSKFIKYEVNNNYNKDNLELYEYKKPKFHISVQEFYKHCENGKYINLDKI